ncbi:hypothetical protein OAN12_04350 [Halioglobus sp.]|nr:hypothetical protein [Halioglobus sp.]
MTSSTLFKKTLLATALFSTSAMAFALPAVVTNGNNDGDGSLRAAIQSGANEIVVATDHQIMITETLDYDGMKALAIYGKGQTVKALGDFTLLTASQGASLKINGLNFSGPGGFDIENQSSDLTMAGKGIFIDVRDDQAGKVKLDLTNVTVAGVANHGIHISDCNLADACGGGGGGAGEGSNASIKVTFNNVTISDAGNGKFDADGLRVDERGNGNITFIAYDSLFTGVGADGVELDEGQNGSVKTVVTNSAFNSNGGYCDPDILETELESFLAGEPDENEFDESDAVTETDIPSNVVGTLDDGCFEREVDLYDSGFVEAYEYGIDVDDGFDIDEAGNGSIIAKVMSSEILDNLDEGGDFDEEDNGDIRLVAIDSQARGNSDDGFKNSESGRGNVKGLFYHVEYIDNGGKGIVLEEEDNGNVTVVVNDTLTENNDDSDKTGLEVVQEDKGQGTLTVRNSSIVDGIDAEGVTVIEE